MPVDWALSSNNLLSLLFSVTACELSQQICPRDRQSDVWTSGNHGNQQTVVASFASVLTTTVSSTTTTVTSASITTATGTVTSTAAAAATTATTTAIAAAFTIRDVETFLNSRVLLLLI